MEENFFPGQTQRDLPEGGIEEDRAPADKKAEGRHRQGRNFPRAELNGDDISAPEQIDENKIGDETGLDGVQGRCFSESKAGRQDLIAILIQDRTPFLSKKRLQRLERHEHHNRP